MNETGNTTSRPQFGLKALFALTTLCAMTLPFVLLRGPGAAVVSLPLASALTATWLCVRACWQADSLPVRVWFLLGAAISCAMAVVAMSVTLSA